MFKRIIRLNYSFCSISKEPNYDSIIKQIMDAQVQNKELKQAIQGIIQDMQKGVQQAYSIPLIKDVLQNVKTQHLCDAAVQQYVGSMMSPKDEKIQKLFMQYAHSNAKTKEEQMKAKYYELYFKKMESITRGNEKLFDEVNEQLIDLADEGCIEAKHLVAKEMFKVAMSMMGTKMKKQKKIMLENAYQLFLECIENEFPHSFYYIGEMAQNGDIPGGINLSFALECYTIAASFGNSQAFFQLSKFYGQGIVVEQDHSLEYLYTKKAAESGLMDAQHNMGVYYREGKIVEKDDLKALAWFSHAGEMGYPQSMYNAAMMYLEGGEGVSVNKKAALAWLEKIQKTETIAVGQLIKKIEKEID